VHAVDRVECKGSPLAASTRLNSRPMPLVAPVMSVV
jgi:hypothetical protein